MNLYLGGMGIRTPDLLIANETLYQLSYDPIHQTGGSKYGVFISQGKRNSCCTWSAIRRWAVWQVFVWAAPMLVRLRRREDGAVKVRSCAAKSRAVSNRNCVVATRGGEQRNENDQSVTQTVHKGGRRELDSVGVDGRAFERLAKPVKRAIGEEPNRRTAG